MENCLNAVHLWVCLNLNGLPLNPDKTEAIVVGTSSDNAQMAGYHLLQKAPIKFKQKAISAVLEQPSTTQCHSATTLTLSASCYTFTRHIHNSIDFYTAAAITCSMVGSGLDYCNSVLYDIFDKNLQKLQLVHNSLAWTVSNMHRSEHITPIPAHLHWPPVQYCIQYKTAIFSFKKLTHQPSYLADVLQLYEWP